MVGFVCESAKDEADGVVNQLKSKTSNEPEKYNFDRQGHSTELDGASLTSLEPFVDFDFITNWIEEMQVPDSADCNKAELGSGLGESSCFEIPIANCLPQGMDDKESSGTAKIECCLDELIVEDRGGVDSVVNSDGFEECSLSEFVKSDLGSTETKHSGHPSEIISDKFEDRSGVDILDARTCTDLGSLKCSIEEGLEKVSLVGGKDNLVIDINNIIMDSKVVSDAAESDSESESESESESDTSSSSSESSSSCESDDETNEKVKVSEVSKAKGESNDEKVDVEEGEIMDSDAEKMVSWTENENVDDDEDDNGAEDSLDLELGDEIDDDEETDLPKGPIRSKNELQELPPVPQVTVNLEPGHQILPVGVVSSVLGTKVIVEGSEKHNPISESSILWIVDKRLPLGIIDEIFGPVKTPYYIVRYNSESEVPSDVQIGTTIGFVSEFAGHVLNDKSVYQKGYDASGKNDEEIFDDHEVEFSDDEKEAEYRRMIKMSKRGNNNESQGTGNQKKNRRNAKSRENTWTSNQPSSSQSSRLPASEPNKTSQHVRSPSPCFSQGNQSGTTSMNTVFTGGPSAQSLGQRNQSGPYPRGPSFSGGPNTFTQMPQPGPIMFNGNWANGMTPQPQNMAMSNGVQPNGNWANGIPPPAQNLAMSSGFQLNGMPWLQQNYPQQMPPNAPFPWQQQPNISQFPLGIPGSSQQQFDLSQLLAGMNGSSMNFNTGVPNAPWSGMLGPNLSGQAPFMGGIQNPNSNAQLPVFSGFMPIGPQGPQPMGLSSNSMSATSFSGNEEVSSQTHQGVASGRGRGRGRKSFQQRGGRSGGRRGR